MEYLKEKLIKEQAELKKRLDTLIEFIDSDKFNKLSENNRKLLINQKIAMTLYLSTLNMRLQTDVDYIDVPDFNKEIIYEESHYYRENLMNN